MIIRFITPIIAAAMAVAAVAQEPVTRDSAPAAPVAAQTALAPDQNDGGARADVPFGVGERLAYDVKFGSLRVGSGYMEVADISELRGREAFHIVFRVRGGTFFYKVNDKYESWFETGSLASLRYRQDIDQGSRERERLFEIYPDRKVYTENGGEEQPSVTGPLDDGSFLYFVRTIPLEVGKSYEFNRYFRPDRNPVRIKVLRRERIKVPAGEFNTIVIQPIIKSKGIFSEGGQAQIWISDDADRVMVQMKSQLKIGSLNLYLRSHRKGQTASR
jgi:hypothetical protein